MSVLLFKEEKSDFSGEKQIRRKKNLQVQLHTKRTEVNKDLEIFILLLSVVPSPQTVHYKLVQGLKCHNLKYFFLPSLPPSLPPPSFFKTSRTRNPRRI